MNEHAKEIWQSALDGETVQHLTGGFDHEWVDMDPFECNYYSQPQQVPDRWRIKPDSETRYFRVYLSSEVENYTIRTVQSYSIPECETQQAIAMTHRGFVRWLNDWTKFEIKEN